jgi:hypothetical protein
MFVGRHSMESIFNMFNGSSIHIVGKLGKCIIFFFFVKHKYKQAAFSNYINFFVFLFRWNTTRARFFNSENDNFDRCSSPTEMCSKINMGNNTDAVLKLLQTNLG